MTFVRARFCELAARLNGLNTAEQYLVGLLSLLPAMLRLPMAQLTPALPLREEVRGALEGSANPERSLLSWLEFHELGDWAGSDLVAESNGLRKENLLNDYAEAVLWAEDALRFGG